jgi:hypothetical protein
MSNLRDMTTLTALTSEQIRQTSRNKIHFPQTSAQSSRSGRTGPSQSTPQHSFYSESPLSEIIISNQTHLRLKLSLYLTKHHDMKTYWRSGGVAPRSLDLSTRLR